MSVDIDAIRDLFVTRLEAIDDTRTAHKWAPQQLFEGDCPQWLIVPAATEFSGAHNAGLRSDRTWRLILFVAKEKALPVGDMEKILDPFFEEVEDEFTTHSRLASTDSQLPHIRLLTDTGPAWIEYPQQSGQWWFGCEWQILVTTKRQVTWGV